MLHIFIHMRAEWERRHPVWKCDFFILSSRYSSWYTQTNIFCLIREFSTVASDFSTLWKLAIVGEHVVSKISQAAHIRTRDEIDWVNCWEENWWHWKLVRNTLTKYYSSLKKCQEGAVFAKVKFLYFLQRRSITVHWTFE
jgi:hypothetical protein